MAPVIHREDGYLPKCANREPMRARRRERCRRKIHVHFSFQYSRILIRATCLEFEMALTFVKSQKGTNLLLHDGYLYYREKLMSDKIIWKCQDYEYHKCRGRCHTFNDAVIKVSDHNHVPNASKVEVKNIMTAIKEQALRTNDKPQNIVCDATVSCSKSASGILPNFCCIKKTIRRTRRKINGVPIAPTSLRELKIPDDYKRTVAGKNFLLYDSGPTNDRILVFSTEENLNFLFRSKHWFADGTFKTSPNLFFQVFTIHGVEKNEVIPCVYALLPNKTEETYIRLLEEVKKLKPNLSPQTVMLDFEKASVNAFHSSFPSIEIRGCFFHFSQSLWRKIQSAGLQTRYSEDADFSLEIRKLAALAFVPEVDVIDCFNIIMDSDFFTENEATLSTVVDYFEDTWIGRLTRNMSRRAPMFAISMWNCFNAVIDDLPKTNNSIEGWHRHFNSLTGSHHPSFWTFVQNLKKEQSLNETKMEQIISGREATKQLKKYRDCANRIKTIVEEYGLRTINDYVQGIAHNLELQK